MVVINTDTILEINTERIAQMNAYECGIKTIRMLSDTTGIHCRPSTTGWRALLGLLSLQRTFLNHLLTRFTYENLLLVSVVDIEAAHEALG